MGDRPSLAFEFEDGIVTFVTGHAFRPEEWTGYCDFIAHVRFHQRGTFVFTLGAGPNARQREELRKAFGEVGGSQAAILSSSLLVRGITMSLNLFLRRGAGFAPDDLDGAIRHVSAVAGPVSRARVSASLLRLAAEVGIELPLEKSAPRIELR